MRLMDARVCEIFGQSVVELLAKHGFREVGRIDDDGWFTRNYFNGRLGIRLLYHLNDKEFSVSRPDRLDTHYPLSLIMAYFSGDGPAGFSLDERARFFDQHYVRIARMLGRRDGGADLKGLHRYIRAYNLARFGLDEPEMPI